MPETKSTVTRRNPSASSAIKAPAQSTPNAGVPDVFVVGAAKSGTTALYQYFKAHPQVFVPSTVKEANFMSFHEGMPPLAGPGDKCNVAGQSVTRWDDYLDLYRRRTDEVASADVSPSYLYYPQAARQIAELCPQAKIVIVLRNPVEAVFSMYAMMRRDRREPCHTFREAFRRSAERLAVGWEWAWDYQRCFLYSQQIARYLNLFPREQLFIRPYRNLKNDPAWFYRELNEFLGISSIDVRVANQNVNVAPSRRDMLARRKSGRLLLKAGRLAGMVTPEKWISAIQEKYLNPPAFVLGEVDRRMLVDYFGRDILKLSQMLAWDVSDWLKT